jgi:hypothetical protein
MRIREKKGVNMGRKRGRSENDGKGGKMIQGKKGTELRMRNGGL